MSKRRKNATLFEVFGGDVSAPQWLKDGKKAAPAQPEHTQLKRPSEIDRPVEKTSIDDYNPPARANKITVTLGYQAVGATVLSLLVVLGITFQLGRWSAGSGSSVNASGQQSELLPGAVEQEEYNFQAAQQMALGRLPSDEVLIIQTGITSEADAQQIQQYLWQAGIIAYVNIESLDNGTKFISIADTVEISGMDNDERQSYTARLAELGKDKNWKLRDKYSFDQTQAVGR